MITICDLCRKAFEPEETGGPRVLRQFESYTVDLRLQQFRRVGHGLLGIEFIEFSDAEGQVLLQKMHQSAVN
jgi:hypothetical protein